MCLRASHPPVKRGHDEQGQIQGKSEDLRLADVISVANLWLWYGYGGSSVQERCGDWIGLLFFYVTGKFIFGKSPNIVSILLFVAPSSLVTLKLSNTRDGAQRSTACFFSCALFCLVAMASS